MIIKKIIKKKIMIIFYRPLLLVPIFPYLLGDHDNIIFNNPQFKTQG